MYICADTHTILHCVYKCMEGGARLPESVDAHIPDRRGESAGKAGGGRGTACACVIWKCRVRALWRRCSQSLPRTRDAAEVQDQIHGSRFTANLQIANLAVPGPRASRQALAALGPASPPASRLPARPGQPQPNPQPVPLHHIARHHASSTIVIVPACVVWTARRSPAPPQPRRPHHPATAALRAPWPCSVHRASCTSVGSSRLLCVIPFAFGPLPFALLRTCHGTNSLPPPDCLTN
jgi:hypothetical protein